MSKHKEQTNVPHRRFSREQGMALVTTLLLLTLLSAVTVGMVLAASSDELINGYYRNMRGSFYAADSGINIARQSMLNSLAALAPLPTATITNLALPPILSTAHQTPTNIAGGIISSYGSNVSMNNGQAANSWPAKFRLTSATLTLLNCNVSDTASPGWSGNCITGAIAPSPANANARPTWTYNYTYSLTGKGQTRAGEDTTLTDRGNYTVVVAMQSAGTVQTSFAAWGFFVDQFAICGSLTLVPGLVTGPAFTNGAWTFGTSGSYIFTDAVGSANANLGYRFSSSNCRQSPNDPYTYSGTTINPDFQAGYALNQAHVDLPEDDFNQKRAVLDGIGGNTNPSAAEMGAVLKTVGGAAYAGANGVYLPYMTAAADCPGGLAPCMVGGGLYVKGNASVTMTASTTDPDRQVYTIVQSGTTTTVTVDLTQDATYPNGYTQIQSGATTTILKGVPTQYDPGSTDPDGSGPLKPPVLRDATMVYVDGDITSLKGPGSGAAAVQDGHALTVVAATDVVVTDDILYKTKPVTTTQNQIPGTPPSTLIPDNDNGQVLGIYTNGGDIRLENCSGCGNLEIDASIAALDDTGTHTLENTGNSINTLTILGGRIQNAMGNINSTTRNVVFDRRFSQGGFAPPWFPSTSITQTGGSNPLTTTSTQRVQWLNQTPF